jgi:hypothetical protein
VADQETTPNPSVEALLSMLMEEMRAGSPLPISARGLRVITGYRQSFETRLQDPTSWEREGGAVRHAARQLGVISSAIASLRRQVEVAEDAVQAAAAVVESNCAIGNPVFGRWCSREP